MLLTVLPMPSNSLTASYALCLLLVLAIQKEFHRSFSKTIDKRQKSKQSQQQNRNKHKKGAEQYRCLLPLPTKPVVFIPPGYAITPKSPINGANGKQIEQSSLINYGR